MNNTPINYLKRVEISGLWQRYDLVWDLNPDVNVLAGINGSGKTTILNCIDNMYPTSKNPFALRLGIIEKIEIFFKDGGKGELKTVRNSDGKVTMVKGGLGGAVVNLNLISTFDSELRPPELLQKVDEQVKTELDFELWKMQKEYTKYQVRIYKYDSETNRNTHIRFLSMINELFSETQKKVNPDKEELEFLLDNKDLLDKDKEVINAYQLSSGEKQLLIILLTVLVQDNKPFILLMDEPEISLHFEWQENLINYIRELNPNVQLIIATHSADLIMKGWGDRVFEVSKLIVKDRLAS